MRPRARPKPSGSSDGQDGRITSASMLRELRCKEEILKRCTNGSETAHPGALAGAFADRKAVDRIVKRARQGWVAEIGRRSLGLAVGGAELASEMFLNRSRQRGSAGAGPLGIVVWRFHGDDPQS
jgi:hypothetical protein